MISPCEGVSDVKGFVGACFDREIGGLREVLDQAQEPGGALAQGRRTQRWRRPRR